MPRDAAAQAIPEPIMPAPKIPSFIVMRAASPWGLLRSALISLR